MVIEITKHVYITDDGREFSTKYQADDHEKFEDFKWFIQSLNLNEVSTDYYVSDWIIDSIKIDKLWKIKDKLVKFLIENKHVDADKIKEAL